MQPCTYIVAIGRNGTLYVGVTSSLRHRAFQHREGLIPGFTKRYNVKLLVWFEFHADMPSAIAREKAIKEWKRAWKIELVESSNQFWRDLYDDIV